MNAKTDRPVLRQESVWDYPRPPRLEACTRLVVVKFAGESIAQTRRAVRVLETSHPPTFYIPPEDVRREFLVPSQHHTYCEFKGVASYWSLRAGDRFVENAAWYYPDPTQAYRQLAGYVAFYPARVDACYVDGERVRAQPSAFYGGWITSDIVGPFKGARE